MKWLIRVALGVIALLLLGAATLFALGMRSDAGVTRGAVEIARSPEAVFTWLEQPARLQAWVGWLVQVDQLAPGEQRWVMEDRNNGNQRTEIQTAVTAKDAPRRLAVHAKSGGDFDGEQIFTLTDLGGRTRLEMTSTYHFNLWLARLMEPVVSHEVKVKMIDDLGRLKSKAEAEMDELRKLQGTWKLVSLEMNGRQLPAAALEGSTLTISGDRFVSRAMGNVSEGVIQVDGASSPRTFDLIAQKGADAGTHSLGIYELNGNRWKSCFAPNGPARPREFGASPGSGFVLDALERQ